jgi:thiol-disulfide isomerase/thioredoxin
MLRALALLLLAAVSSTNEVSLSAKDLGGNAVSLDQYRGKIVVLNFWATWCVPCKDEMKLFTAAQNQYADKGVTVIAASLDDAKDRKDVDKFIKKQKMTMPVWLGITPEMSEKVTGSQGLPVTLFLDRDGHQIARIVGQIREKELQDRIAWSLSDRSGPEPAADVDHFKK